MKNKAFEVGNLGASAALNPNRVQVRVGMQEGGKRRYCNKLVARMLPCRINSKLEFPNLLTYTLNTKKP